jgi:Tol biopolymer transport system component
VYNLTTKALTNLTDDIYTDEQPTWSPDSKTVYFVSDRAGAPVNDGTRVYGHHFHDLNIYQIDRDGQNLRQLTSWVDCDQTSPVASPDG